MPSDNEKLLSQIRKLYHPYQPSVESYDGEVEYVETSPINEISNYVYCFWVLKSTEQLAKDFEYKVVADGCIDVFFELKNPSDIFIMGFCDQFTSFNLGRDFHFVGIRFFPSIIPLLFDVDAQTLKNNFHRLVNILPQFDDYLRDHFSDTITSSEFQTFSTAFLIHHLKDLELEIDLRFFDSLISIFSSLGMVDVISGLKTGLSPRQLRRVFNFNIGTTPKSFAKVVRFQKVIESFHQDSNESISDIYYKLGFYDQAHFIKDFKNYYGVLPARALG